MAKKSRVAGKPLARSMADVGGLALLSEIHKQLHQATENGTPLTCAAILDRLLQLQQALQSEQREHAFLEARAVMEKDQLRSELHCELVDREANAARVIERQRFLFERSTAQPGQSSAAERASASALYVEAALVALCPHSTPRSPGCTQLAEWPGN